jgi:2-methylcitrate dehydratase PrpD
MRMSSAVSSSSASEALAAFIASPHAGAGFDAAMETARTRIAAARSALREPSAAAELANRALPPYGGPLRHAFAYGVILAEAAVTDTGNSTDSRADAAIVAAALALAGDALAAEAVAIGCEVAARLRRALAFDAAWDAGAVTAGIGAAAAAARAAGLDAAAARDAIGLAATQAAGLGAVCGTAAGALGCGKAAADALEAAQLARAGFTAAPASLEGRRGLAALMASRFDPAVLLEGLGGRWVSAEP